MEWIIWTVIGVGTLGYGVGVRTGWKIGEKRQKRKCMEEVEHLIDMYESTIDEKNREIKQLMNIIKEENEEVNSEK